jgi:hypothetical protein
VRGLRIGDLTIPRQVASPQSLLPFRQAYSEYSGVFFPTTALESMPEKISGGRGQAPYCA